MDLLNLTDSSMSIVMPGSLSCVSRFTRSRLTPLGAALLCALTPACWHTVSPSEDGAAGAKTTGGGAGLGAGASGGGGGMGGSSMSGAGTGASPTSGAPGAGGSTGGSSTSAGTGGSSGGMGGAAAGMGGTTASAGAGAGGAPQPMVSCMGNFESASVNGMQSTVTVDNATSKGDLPHFWNTFGTGELPLFLRQDRMTKLGATWGQTLMDHVTDGVHNLGVKRLRQHGLFHDDIGIYHEDSSGNPVYDFTKSDQIFDFFVQLGIEPIVELAPMPHDLAADPSKTVFDWNMIVSVPKDYGRWQDLVTKFVQHSVERYGQDTVNSWYFEVWNEPECCNNKFWSGTIDDYFKLYDYTAAGVRAALPTGRVGGPVNSQPVELTQNSMIGQKFLQHVTTDNYLNPGHPGVLDYFSYHSWSFLDGSINGYFAGLDLLDSFKLQNIQIAITEFGPTYEFNLMDEPQEMDQGATFAVQTYSDIVQRCTKDNRRLPIAYSWWVLSDIFDESMYRENDPFIGCMGLTSRENIHKPVYNAYKFLEQMGTHQISFTISGAAGLGGMAARSDDGGVELILYNGQNPGVGPKTETYYQVADAQSIGVTISGLDPSFPFDVNAYHVDHVNGNAYAVWQNLGRPDMTTMTDDNWQALRDAMDSPEEPLGRALCGSTFTHAFQLQSPGVLFVKLAPAAAPTVKPVGQP
jgi:xylan 1,4-beta-xylosidase